MKENDNKKEDIRINLKDAGCCNNMIGKYLAAYDEAEYDQQLHILKKQRCVLLTKLHVTQKQIDCLDYLIYNMSAKRK